MSDDLVKRFEHLGKAADLLKVQAAEITRLRAALATARRDGMKKAMEIFMCFGRITEEQRDAIRAAAREVSPGEHLSEAEQEREWGSGMVKAVTPERALITACLKTRMEALGE
jgi:hypothetical protein